MESQGKSWKKLVVMESQGNMMENQKKNQKSWKSKNFTLICVQNIGTDMADSKFIQFWIFWKINNNHKNDQEKS